MSSAARWVPRLALLGGVVFLLVVPLVLVLRSTGGHLVCASDDPYIHMAMAKNLVESGVWGVSRGEFSSSSSSPLWTLVLAGWFALFGVQETAPILLNFVVAGALSVVSWRLFASQARGASEAFLAFATLILLVSTPMSALVFIGQEHLLQTLLTLVVVVLSVRVLLEERGGEGGSGRMSRNMRALLVLTPLYTATRYEGAALVGVVCGLLVLRRKWGGAAALGAVAALPIVLYGAYSLAHGAAFLPNSVLLRMDHTNAASAEPPLFAAFGGTALEALWRTKHLLGLTVVSMILFVQRYRRVGFWEPIQLMAVVFVLATLAHLQFGKTGWFFRYEAYLVALGVFQTTLAVRELVRIPARRAVPALAIAGVVAIAGYALLPRAARSFRLIHRGATNIFEQQVQMGRFLREYYAGSTVALNDIGAPTFFGDVRCLDLVGLANFGIATRMRAGDYATADIDRVAKEEGATIAIVYESWFERFGGLPSSWKRAGTWRIWDNVVCGSDTVSFFAVEPEAFAPLVTRLRAFDASLPDRVTRAGAFR